LTQWRLLTFSSEAAAAEGLVGFGSSDEDLAALIDLAVAEEGRGAVAAAGAESGQSRDSVGEGDAIENLAEWFSVKVAVEADDDDVSPEILDLALGEEDEVVEELGFVDDDGLYVSGNVVGDLHEPGVGGVAGDADAVVGHHFGGGGVADVGAGLDDEDVRPDAASTPDGRVDEAGLAGKHGTHNDFEAHSVVCYEFLGKRNYPFSQEKLCGLKVRIKCRQEQEDQTQPQYHWIQGLPHLLVCS